MENIALAFSGGGFRAASYCLGVLSYLNRVPYKGKPLLQNVKFISSTSGGSIANLAYSSFLFKGKDFNAFYNFLNNALEGEKLVTRALTLLRDKKAWKKRPEKSRNLINAFSMAYDEMFEEAVFGLFSDRQHNPHLEEICITSTEFTNGQVFRFQTQHPNPEFPSGRIGNFNIFFKEGSIAFGKALKLADILASSSCFPSGFEPMIFPNDYTTPVMNSDQLRQSVSFKANTFKRVTGSATTGVEMASAEVREAVQYNHYDPMADKAFNEKMHFGIMDGGVADNQAIDALKRANSRRHDKKLPEFDLVMSCDVTSFLMDGYSLPLKKNKWYSNITPLNIFWGWLAGAAVLPALFILQRGPWPGWAYVAATLSALLWLPLLWIGAQSLKKLTQKPKPPNIFSTVVEKFKGMFLRLNLGTWEQMIAARAKSVIILANDIYLKQLRRIYYESLFENDQYKKISILNAIYSLSPVKINEENKAKEVQPEPSALLVETAEKARVMGTTLWFDQTHQQNRSKQHIIATGQFTTCYKLLKHLAKKEKDAPLTPELLELRAALQADWEAFCRNPTMMVDDEGKV